MKENDKKKQLNLACATVCATENALEADSGEREQSVSLNFRVP